jgi:predicted aspartyl protease
MWLATAVVGACAGSRSEPYPAVILPERPSSAVLPIRDPILRPDLAVEAVLHGPGGKTAAIWLLLDSGATIGSLPTAVAAALGLVEERSATMLAVNGAARTSLVVAPRLDLGELGVSRVAFLVNTLAGPASELGLAGQSVLARMPWEIDWDRGVVTLGATTTATAWADSGEVASLPLEPFRAGVEMVTARINGRPLRMMLDTGALVSAIPESAAAEMGLEAETVPPHTFGGATGPFRADRVYVADIELGSAKLRGQRFMTSVARNLAVLGRDILGQFNVAVVPGHRLSLRRRGDLRATAEARVRRWRWMPACRSTGCARARIEPAAAAGRLELDLEASLPGPIEILFACADSPAGTEEIVTSGQRALDPDPPGLGPPTFNHLIVGLRAPTPGKTYATLADAAAFRASPAGPPCRELTVLDVAPASQIGRERAEVYVRPIR